MRHLVCFVAPPSVFTPGCCVSNEERNSSTKKFVHAIARKEIGMDANLIPSPGPKASGPQGAVRVESRPASGVPRQPYPGKLPARLGREEIAVTGPDVAARRHAGATAQHVLIAHEFAVVFSHRAAVRPEAGIGFVGAAGPLPGVAVELGRTRPAWPGGRGPRIQVAAFQHVGVPAGVAVRLAARGRLPFGFAWQPDPRPAGVGVGLEVAHMRDGRLQLQFLHAVQREDLPVVALPFPVERCAPALRADAVPSLRQPQFRPRIAAVAHEGQVFVLRHEPVGQVEAAQQRVMGRAFIVEGEAVAVVADAGHATRVLGPAGRRGGRQGGGAVGRVGRPERVGVQQVLDVGEDQFLVLLLVVEPQFQQGVESRVAGLAGDQRVHGFVHMLAVAQYLGQVRAREQAALRPRMARADGVVVGVEQHAVAGMEGAIARRMAAQQEGLEEPGGVRQMPFDGAAVRHGLRLAVFGAERGGQGRRGRAHSVVAAGQAGRTAASGAGQQAGRVHAYPPGGVDGAEASRPQARARKTENQPRESDQWRTSR